MSNKANVQSFRVRMKERIVKAMGGSCCICNYSKCNSALALHHLDPTQKDFSISEIRANFVSWELIVNELRKCILLCHNCHSEVHAGITLIPVEPKRFDERYVDYKELEKVRYYCTCGSEKKRQARTCGGNICLENSHSNFDWSKYDLIEMVKTMTNVKIAKLLGLSETAVRKRKKKLNIL